MIDDDDLVCGCDGSNVLGSLDGGDVFLGGEGDDVVELVQGGIVNGGEGGDLVVILDGGTFSGGAGEDAVRDLRDTIFNE